MDVRKLCWTRLFKFAAGALFAGSMIAIPVFAVHNGTISLFELDGNAADSPVGGAQDWQNIAPHTAPPPGFSGLATTGIIADTSGLTTFETGSKDTEDVSEWRHGAGSSPPKDEITNAYAAGYTYTGANSTDGTLLTGDLIIYAGMDRFATNGTANVGFWFFQQNITRDDTTGTFVGNHVIGDLLVVVEFTGGGRVANARVYRWNGSTIELVQTLADADCATTHAAGDPCGRSNSGPTQLYWPYTGKNNVGTNVADTGAFVEFGVNVTRLVRLAGGGPVPCFASFMATTRTSVSETATIKDFTGPSNFFSCGIAITKTCPRSRPNANQTGYVWDFEGTVTNAGSATLHDVVVKDSGPDQVLGTADDLTPLSLASLVGGAVANYSGSFETIGTTPNPAINIARVDAAIVSGGPKVVSDGPVQANCPQVTLAPGLSVTKECETRLDVLSGRVVVRVLVSGRVCNTGSSNLTGVSVVNDNGTPSNTTDDSTLLSGGSIAATEPDSCLTYSGNYLPSGILSNPTLPVLPDNAQFQDTVRANGTAALGQQNPTEATATDTCRLCPAVP